MQLEWVESAAYWRVSFTALGGPCEVLVDSPDRQAAETVGECAQNEALRIEHKYSRYREDSELSRINRSDGQPIMVDEETAQLLDYADLCYRLSEGKFDISSGVLRKLWQFDGSDHIPDPAAIKALLNHVGWEKVSWRNSVISLPPGMELDLGGIGKEYAVDRSAQLCRTQSEASLLVNYGGDMAISKPRRNDQSWMVGVDDPHHDGGNASTLHVRKGGSATSGDARRFLLKDGVRYGHILDPLTGWPIPDAPRSVTVAAATCLEAGMLATLAMLQGAGAENFLQAQQVTHRCIW